MELAVGAGCGPGGGGLGGEARFSFSRLPDGASLLCRTVDAGRGVRAIHLTEPETALFVEQWPVTLLAAHVVRDAGDPDDELPGSGGYFGREELVGFARAHEPRVAPFLADVRRLFDDPAGRQLVVAEESPDTVARWIALACASLPPAYVPSLTFTTRAADPGRAPQHIVGIGPDAAFDRFDDTVLDHLYRVHDGLDGPGSPPLTDTWATWTARLWTAGAPVPRAGDGGAEAGEEDGAELGPEGGPFAPSRLVPALLHAGLLSGAEVAGLPGDQARQTVDALVAMVWTVASVPASGGDPLLALTALCRDIARHAPDLAAPLALALARHRLGAAEPQDLVGELAAACAELPLGADAARVLRAEYGGDVDEELRRALRDPMEAWVEPLRLVAAVGADDGRGLDAATNRLSRALRDVDDTTRARAVRVLDAVGDASLTRRVLGLLGGESSLGRLNLLRGLAASAQGDWLRRNLDENSPLPLRLAEATARWSGPGNGLRGIALFAKLTEVLRGHRVTDAATLAQMWRLVWPGGAPEPAELPWVARTCTVRLLIEAGLGRHMRALVTAPDRVDRETVTFARDMLHDRLNRQERATAQLLVLAQELADQRLSVRQEVPKLQALMVDAAPLGHTVRHGVGALVARALVHAEADQLARQPVFRHLIHAGPELLLPYRQLMLDEAKQDQLARDLPVRPHEVGAYYFLWRPLSGPGVSHDWRRVSEELLREILGPVVAGLDEEALSGVANAVLDVQGEERLKEWNAWRDSLRGG
ncbi:GTPase-associated protein 1-related protein [Streptomyces aurantiacus]|uniref:GTPase-associated protein 1-related protein n=1 Tax=Streptomyces aurantiacus TaxID=47760 RepID=UPI000419A191|nr:GTPase-associated protein 1-related protein [Streptomyces aurantiacus]